jgi:hypothetical protein
MRRWHLIAMALCVVATVVVWMRAQTLQQRSNAVEFGPESPKSAVASEAIATAPAPESPEDTREVARLRNEVVQLRMQKKELEAVQRENAQLKSAMTAIPVSLKRESPHGFTAKEKLSNVGYTTPADAVQTFFWAMRDGNFDAMVASFAPSSKERQRFEQMSPEQREKLRQKMQGQGGRPNPVDQLTDVGVRNQEDLSEGMVAVHIGSSINTNTVRMRLEHTPDGWKAHDPGF